MLERVLMSIAGSRIDMLYVVDNSPNDELRAIVAAYAGRQRLEYLFGHGNVGYGRGNNMAMEKALDAGFRYHLVLNPDVEFGPEVIATLASYMETHPDVGLISPKVRFPDGRLQYLCKLLPAPVDIIGRRLLPARLIRRRNSRYEMHFTGYDRIWNCPSLSGCFMFMRMSAVRKAGLFDPRYFMYFEDIDLTRRLHMEGRTLYYPHVSIIHGYASEHRHNTRLFFEAMVSAVKYFNKWGGWTYDSQRKFINDSAIYGGPEE